MDPAIPVARAAARDLAKDGAEAVVLVGSHARGDAEPGSDLDLLAVGPDSYLPVLDRREGFLVSASIQRLEVHRESFGLPELLCEAVSGWRDALVLHDPDGLAASLIAEAKDWDWHPLEHRCNAWVAEQVAARAETVQKLISSTDKERPATAAVKRSLLATRLAQVLAVHHRILYGSENRLWDLVSDAMGEEWRRAQYSALGLDGETFEETCGAALRLYGLAADETADLFDGRQRRVVHHALELAGYSRLAGGSESP